MSPRTDRSDVVVVGAGGHALVAIEVLRAAGHEVRGCVTDDGQTRAEIGRLGVELLGDRTVLAARLAEGQVNVFVAIGDNRARHDVTLELLATGAHLVPAVDPTAVVSPSAAIAEGALVMPGVVVNALARIGIGAILNTGATVDHECDVGTYAHLAPNASLAGNVTIGVGAMLGIGAAVTPGRKIGAWSTIGAGATVLDDVADGATVVGTPAREVSGR